MTTKQYTKKHCKDLKQWNKDDEKRLKLKLNDIKTKLKNNKKAKLSIKSHCK